MDWKTEMPRRKDTALEYRNPGETGMRVWGISRFNREGSACEDAPEADGELSGFVPGVHHLP